MSEEAGLGASFPLPFLFPSVSFMLLKTLHRRRPHELGKASDKSVSVLSELGVTDGVPATSPVYVGPVSGTPLVLGNALTIQLPLPLDELGLADSGTSKLILVYVIYVKNAWISGMIPLTTENLEGTFVKQELPGLGYYQIVYLNSARGPKEVASEVRPGLAK